MPYSLEFSSRGTPVLTYTDDSTGKKICMHSTYSPEKEAVRLIDSFDPGRSGLIIITGIGLGYHVAEMKNKYPTHKIIVLEEDVNAAEFCRKINPHSLEGVQIIFQKENLLSIIEEEDISYFRGFRTLYFRTAYSVNPRFYDDIISDTRKLISSKVSDLLTRYEFEELWAENIVNNIPKIVKSHRIIELFGKYSSFPGVIISAGPSLRKNIKSLKSLEDKAVLVCVDTALPVVEKFGVKPHFILALDAQKHTLKHFLPHMDCQVPLISDTVSCPRVTDEYNGTVIFSSTAKYYDSPEGGFKRETTPFMDWLEKYIRPVGDIQSGGSVATTAFDFLLNLGCNSIILVGQDLAYTGREIHSSGTHHNDNWCPITNRLNSLETINQKIITKRKIKYIEAYGGRGTVITDFVLDMYRNWFEDSVSRVGIPVYNATEGGARINGCIEKSLAEIADKLKNSDITPYSITENILALHPAAEMHIKEAVNSSCVLLDNLISFSENSKNDARAIATMLKENDLETMLKPFLKKANTHINRTSTLQEQEITELYRGEVIRSGRKLKSLFQKIYPNL